MYELIIIWDTGEEETHKYPTEEQANIAGQEMKTVFGNQIEWYGVRRRYKIYADI